MRWPPRGRGGRHPDPEGNDRPLARRRRPPPAAACRHAEEVDIGAPLGEQAMTLLLRRQNAQDRHEGREPFGWKDDDYAVLDDETVIGRIYRERLPTGDKWCWFLQVMGAPPPNRGIADTLDEAKAGIAASYEAAGRPP